MFTTAEPVLAMPAPLDEWRAARRAGIGSSDAPAIAGYDRYRSPYAVWLDKRGELVDDQDSAAIEWGHRLEDVVAVKAAEVLDAELMRPPAMYRSTERPWQLANPDRFLHGELLTAPGEPALLEIKTTSGYAAADQWDTVPPARVQLQVQHQHAVLGTERGFVAVLVDGRDFRLFPCDRDDEAIAILNDIEATFWSLVENVTPPALDGTDSTTNALNVLYAVGDPDETVELPADARGWCDSLRLINRELKQLETRREELRNRLRAALGTATIGLIDGEEAVTWRTVTRAGYAVADSSYRKLELSRKKRAKT